MIKVPLLNFAGARRRHRLRLFAVLLSLQTASAQIGEKSDSVNFDIVNDCTCPGNLISYKCKVVGSGFTGWRGTAFDCSLSGNEILLLHSNFNSGTSRTCSNGQIVGRSLSVINDCFYSQLDVNVTTHFEGRTVECLYESGLSAAVPIGSATISLTTDPFPLPSNVRLMEVGLGTLTFNWSSVSTKCPSLYYNINSTCGDCPTTTQLNAVTCAVGTIANNHTCSFSVRSVVCGNIMSNWSTPIYAILKVPEAPVISSIVTRYGTDEQKKLINLDVNFNEEGSFTISEGVNSSPSYYTVLFSSDSLRQTTMCGSANISASHCLDGLCTASLPSSCYQVTGNTIRVTVSATNSLGEGSNSTAFIGTINQYVDVTFESAREVVCKFLGPAQTPSEVLCSITYGPCQQRLNMSAEGSSISVHESHTTVRIDLSTNLNTYCYLIMQAMVLLTC